MLDTDETWFVYSALKATVDDTADLDFIETLQVEALEMLADVCQ